MNNVEVGEEFKHQLSSKEKFNYIINLHKPYE